MHVNWSAETGQIDFLKYTDGVQVDCFAGVILGQLKWESLKKRSEDNRLILFIPKTRRARNQHSMAFQTPTANTDVYKGSFFPKTTRDWNALPDSLISSAEEAEDCVAKFTSLVSARDYSVCEVF